MKHLIIIHIKGEIYPFLIESEKDNAMIQSELKEIKEKILNENISIKDAIEIFNEHYKSESFTLNELFLEIK